MTKTQKPPVVVAELGRPETPGETSARKAEQSRLYRQRKTVNNLVLSLLVTLALVIVMVLIVPRGTDQWSQHAVNVAEAAEQNAETAGLPLIAPNLPDTWKAKQAALRSDKGSDILAWLINYTTENEAYAAVVQAFTRSGERVNDTWIGTQLEGQQPTGEEALGGLEWTVYDHPKRNPDESNMVFGLRAHHGATTLLVYGTDRPEVLRALAAEVAEQALALNTPDTDTATVHTTQNENEGAA